MSCVGSRGVSVQEDEGRFVCDFDWMGVQRHLKAAGIFARLHRRDHRDAYRGDLPRTFGYLSEVCGRCPAPRPRWSRIESRAPREAT